MTTTTTTTNTSSCSSPPGWTEHPNPYYVRYEKVKVPVGVHMILKVRKRDGMAVCKKMEVVEDYVMQRRAYNLNGSPIGSVAIARYICNKMGIDPEPMHPGKICCIGKSRKNGKWYGWSHRAIYGFQVGDEVMKGDITNSSGFTVEYLRDHPEEDLSLPVGFIAKTEDDARRMAIAFAESVS